MKPIVIVTNHRSVVISPKEDHSEESWRSIYQEVRRSLTQEIQNSTHKITLKDILSLVERNPEWNCVAVESDLITTWTLVE